ncbi:PstS family phosphate ABC transporter substrate-binding protein [Geitlerinema splendidum]|nr:PstS family phosphate ABC transporter substrate-binding protein [Geitlerinema splendidum]
MPVALVSALAIGLVGCGSSNDAGNESGGPSAGSKVSGSLTIDGSGTVFPIGAALAEMFNASNPDVNITVGNAGTGAGFEKFAKGEIEISNASRPVKDSELKKLQEAGVEFYELPVAYDGLCIIIHPSNTWLKSITLEQLNKIWDKDSKVKMWSDVDPTWPKQEIKLYGATSAHGTYEYFNEVVNGDKENVRADYSQQAEYDPLIQGVANEPSALGYVGYAYALDNASRVKTIPIDSGKGAITPSEATILDGSYAPFSRPLMMYVSKKAYDSNPAVKAFTEFALTAEGGEAVKAAGYVPLASDTLMLIQARLQAGRTGSILSGADSTKSLIELFKS